MKTEIKEISPTRRELQIEVDTESIKEAYGKVSQRFAKGANVPGFRKGLAPLDVIRLRYKEEIRQEVLQLLLPDKVAAAVEEHGVQPLAEPQIHIENIETVQVNGSEPISMHVHLEVMPTLPDPEYKGIELKRQVKPVNEEQVEELIARRAAEQAALIPVEDRVSETGDTVVVDLEGKFEDDPEGEPITAEDLEIKIGDEMIEASFTENLAGVKPDETKDFTVTYADDFSSPALAGKTVHYKANVKAVGRMEAPEIDDEWAKSLDEGYESMDDLRTKLRADLESVETADADARVRNEAIATLIEKNGFEVPGSLIENQAQNLLNNFAKDLQGRGVDLKKVERDFIEMAYTQMREQAERDVRGAMLLEKVGELEKIEISDEDVKEEIAKMAEYYNTTPDKVEAALASQGGTAGIENNLRTRRSIEKLVEHAKVTEEEWVEEAPRNETEAPAEVVDTSEVGETAEASEEKPKKKPAKKKSAKGDAA